MSITETFVEGHISITSSASTWHILSRSSPGPSFDETSHSKRKILVIPRHLGREALRFVGLLGNEREVCGNKVYYRGAAARARRHRRITDERLLNMHGPYIKPRRPGVLRKPRNNVFLGIKDEYRHPGKLVVVARETDKFIGRYDIDDAHGLKHLPLEEIGYHGEPAAVAGTAQPYAFYIPQHDVHRKYYRYVDRIRPFPERPYDIQRFCREKVPTTIKSGRPLTASMEPGSSMTVVSWPFVPANS